MTLREKTVSKILKIKRMIISITKFNDVHLGDLVLFNNEKWVVVNGNAHSSNGEELFTLSEYKAEGWEEFVPRSKIKKYYNLATIKNSIFSYYKFWKTYWYRIELDDTINKEKNKWYESILQ